MGSGKAQTGAATRQPQTISWSGTTNEALWLNAPYLLGATASSGLAVRLKVLSGPAVLGDGTITLTNLGSVQVEAEQAGDGRFAATRETRSFEARKVKLNWRSICRTGPEPLGLATTAFRARGDHAYLGAYFGLEVFSLKDARNPVKLSSIPIGFQALDLEVVGNYVYFAGSDARLCLVEVSDPAQPLLLRHLGNSEIGSFSGIRIVGDVMYVANPDVGLEIFDVSDRVGMRRLGLVNFRLAGRIRVAGNRAYLACGPYGLHVADVGNPRKPRWVGGFGTGSGVWGLGLLANHVVLGSPGIGLHVLDARESASLGQIGFAASDLSFDDLDATGRYAVALGARIGDSVGHLGVFDVSNPSVPVQVGDFPTTGRGARVQFDGNRAYVSEPGVGLEILDLDLPSEQVISLNLPSLVPFQRSFPSGVATSTSGLPVALSVLSGPARMEEGLLVLTGLGEVKLRAEQAGNDEFLPASTEWTITVTLPQIGARVVEGAVELQWAAGLEGVELQLRESWSGGSGWMGAAGEQIVAGGEVRVRVQPNTSERYYRLIKH